MYKLGIIITLLGIIATAVSLSLMRDILVIELSILTLAAGITALFLERKRQEYHQAYAKEQLKNN